MNCPKCNKPVPANARFCGSCGQSIEGAASPSAAPPPTPAMAGATPASAAAATSKAWAAAAASAPGLLTRVKNIVLAPKSEWPVIAPEPTTISQLYAGYVMPLAVLAALLGFVRMSVLGVNTAFGGGFRMPIGSGLTYTVMMFVSALIGVFIVGFIINALAPTFSGQRDRRQALKVAAYSLTPAMLSSVLALSPILPTLLQLLAGLYGIYVLNLGLPVVMQSPKEKAFGYTVSVVICTILVGIVFAVLSSVAHIGGGRMGLLGGTPAERAAERAAARDQGAAAVGNTLGDILGTDAKGKAGLSAALSNLAKAGEAQAAAQNAATASPSAGQSPAADTAQNPQGALSATGGLLNALGGALGGPNRVATVDFKTLKGLLPASLPGMTRTSAQGENQGAIGVKTSSAKADYAGKDGTGVHIEIADISGVSGLMDLAGGLIQQTTSESDSGYEKDVVISGRTAHEKYDARNKKGELSAVLVKRFSVDITGSGVDMQLLEQSLGQIDLSQLESMKDVGAQPK
ncbi:MAG TPA: YIP1 family protein [Steroidobacteraceae bacterium]|nr:YIP1 family protein [Steroidobacteraceae bacterium]